MGRAGQRLWSARGGDAARCWAKRPSSGSRSAGCGIHGRVARGAGGRIPSQVARVSECTWGWLKVGGMFDVGSRGPRWMPQGSLVAGPPSRSSRRGGHRGRPRGLRGVAGACAPVHSASWEMRASCSCSRSPPRRWPASCFAASRGQNPYVAHCQGADGARVPGRVPLAPAGSPTDLGCVAQGSGGAAGPLKGQCDHCGSQPAMLQLLGAMDGWSPHWLTRNERRRGRF